MKNNNMEKIELKLPISIVSTANNDGYIIKDASNIEYFFYNKKDSKEMEYDGWSCDITDEAKDVIYNNKQIPNE